MNRVSALFAGVLFGAGLAISGMSNPDKVLAFLTLSSEWDPALIVVMASALVITTIGFFVARRMSSPLFADRFEWPLNKKLDLQLLGGSAIFGVGWGLTGYCPGPALVGLFILDERAAVLIASFVIGLILFEVLNRKITAPAEQKLSDG